MLGAAIGRMGDRRISPTIPTDQPRVAKLVDASALGAAVPYG